MRACIPMSANGIRKRHLNPSRSMPKLQLSEVAGAFSGAFGSVKPLAGGISKETP